jgi:high-affinity iron transporter
VLPYFLKKINTSKTSKLDYIILFFSLFFLIFFNIGCSNNSIAQIASYNSTVSALNSPGDSLPLNLNLKRIDVQLDILLDKINNGDSSFLFEHSYIIHSSIYPTILNFTNNLNREKSQQLEEYLADLPLMIKSNQNSNLVKNQINNIKNILQYFNSKIFNAFSTKEYQLLSSQTILNLLNDAKSSYGIYINSSKSSINDLRHLSAVDYENTLSLINKSNSIYNSFKPEMHANLIKKTDSLFGELRNIVSSKNANIDAFDNMVNSIENSLAEFNKTISSSFSTNNSYNNSYNIYFDNIRNLLSNATSSIKNENNYQKANDYVTTAYLDNFEYLEPVIEKINATLKVYTEVSMREQLRSLINNYEPFLQIQNLITKINSSLTEEEKLLSNKDIQDFVGSLNNISKSNSIINGTDINALKAGFGVYTGERRAMGNSTDAYKSEVKDNIDSIRLKLNDAVLLYEQNNQKQAFSKAQSAYLDSYENIEIPLRPINPDFVLDMEIKFAELRNLISSSSPSPLIVKKISEIQKGLDESERLVSGTGSVAPTIAFSSSFSVIFREGLESALIIGAILTYLEASRNEKFKKYVYYGIILAIGITIITWYFAEYMIKISGVSREIIEAVAGLSAVAVLFWVSFWILNKIETKKWIEFVKAKVWQATTTGSFMVFTMLSFFTVYREGFETVLFYQALFSFAKYMESYVAAGLVTGLGAIIGVVFLIRKFGKKLPLRALFGLTIAVGSYMSITFIGNAIRELQEAGYISTTQLFGTIPRLDINLAEMTGIHPTLETIIGQVILLSIYVAGSFYVLVIQPRKKQTIAAMRKSVKDKKTSSSTS